MQDITIIETATSTVLAQIKVPTGKGPIDVGFPFDAKKHRAFTVTKQGDVSSQKFNAVTGKWEDDLAKVERALIEAVKDEGERRKMFMASRGGMKKTIYAAKQAEVEAYGLLGNTLTQILAALLAMPAVKRNRKFRYAIKEAALRGEPNIDATIARFASGADPSNEEVSRLEAIEQIAVEKIRLATTAAAKRTAANSIVW